MEQLLTAAEVATAAGIEPDAVHRARQRGQLEAVELPKKGRKPQYRYRWVDVVKVWPEAQPPKPSDEV